VVAVACLLLMAIAGAVWQFGPYGLYGGAVVGLAALSFVNIEKGDSDDG
jgi:hypothetical protein